MWHDKNKQTVTTVNEIDGGDKEIDQSIHTTTVKTGPVTKDKNPGKRTISKANLEGNY